MKLPGCIALALVLLTAPALAAGEEKVLGEGWYALYFGGAKSGWSHERTTERGDDGAKRIVTFTEMLISIERAGAILEIRASDEIEEDAAGKVLRFHRVQALGAGKQETTGILLPDGAIQLRHGKGEPIRVAQPEGALGPAAVGRKVIEAGIEAGTKLTLPVFSPDFLGKDVEVSVTVGKLETIDLLGRMASLRRVESRVSAMPDLPIVTWLDEEHVVQVMKIPFPGLGAMRMIRTAREVALRPGEPAEMFTTTFATPDRIIEDPRRRRRAGYLFRAKSGRLPDLPSGGGQTVERREDGSLRVVLDLTRPVPEGYDLPCRDRSMGPFLRPNRYLQSDDARVVALAREAVGEPMKATVAARAIERVARKRITKKNMNVAFATAAEVAEHLEGDCSEHAVLCAAMARAVGLPSRVVMGLVYLGPGLGFGGKTGIFGYHMWTEVWVGEGRWLSIDAAMNGMDATHIAIRRTALDEVNPLVELSLPLLGFIGNLEITVLVPE